MARSLIDLYEDALAKDEVQPAQGIVIREFQNDPERLLLVQYKDHDIVGIVMLDKASVVSLVERIAFVFQLDELEDVV